MEAPVPRDDWRPRRTCGWKEPGPKAKEWGAERPWSERESSAFSLFVFNRELSTTGFSQILRSWLCCPAVSGPWGVFPWWAECLHVCSRSRPCLGRQRVEAGSSSAFVSTAWAINSWVWLGLFVQERWPLRSSIVTLSGQRRCVLWPAPGGGPGRAKPGPPPGMVSGTGRAPWLTASRPQPPPPPPPGKGAVGACSPAGGWSKWPSEWPSAVHGGLRGCSFLPSLSTSCLLPPAAGWCSERRQ